MRKTFSHRRHSFPTARRKFDWINVLFDFGNTAIASGAQDMLADWRTKMGLLANLPDMTVVRVRGQVTYALASGAALTYQSAFVPGLIVQESSTPAANVPNPVNQPDDNWLYWESLTPFQHNSSGASAALGSDYISTWQFDTKAMRKMPNILDTLWFSFGASPATTWKVRVGLAIGVKLP